MLAASRRYVASCTACQRRKGAIARTPLQSMPDVAEPFERLSVDILTLTPSARGNKYVLVLIDHLTRFVELFPLATKDAQTVADVFLAEFVTRYGPPRTLLSDNGLEFRNRLLSDICHHLQLGWPLVRPPERLVSVGPPITIEGGGLDRGSITKGIWSLCIAALSCTPVTEPDPWVPDGISGHCGIRPSGRLSRLDGTAPPDPESDMGPLQDPGADDLLDSESSAPSSEGVDDEPWDPGSDWDEAFPSSSPWNHLQMDGGRAQQPASVLRNDPVLSYSQPPLRYAGFLAFCLRFWQGRAFVLNVCRNPVQLFFFFLSLAKLWLVSTPIDSVPELRSVYALSP
ncbi:integrase core domain containing protein [Penaeus vannamei]|uniref:Integrase core domain containing protein n=1 Tax=Penaeus vannamei TaxID=6689 RepID=A0A423T5S3_PENVA|nr:integrase core domain containing protein [Penaeus vannamei]